MRTLPEGMCHKFGDLGMCQGFGDISPSNDSQECPLWGHWLSLRAQAALMGVYAFLYILEPLGGL